MDSDVGGQSVSALLRKNAGRLRAGVKLKGRPVVGLAKYVGGVEEREFCGAQRGGWIFTAVEAVIEFVHELRRCRGVADFPESADDIVSARAQESPRKTDEALAGIGTRAGTVAGRNGDEFGVEMATDDIASVEFVRISAGIFAEDDSGIERASAAGCAVSDEVEISEMLGVASEVGGRRRLLAAKNFEVGVFEIALDDVHFIFGVRQAFEFGACLRRVADEKKAFLFGEWTVDAGG